MRNLLCLLPDGHIEVAHWEPHPCGGYYQNGAYIYGKNGMVGRSMVGFIWADNHTPDNEVKPLFNTPKTEQIKYYPWLDYIIGTVGVVIVALMIMFVLT